MSSLQVDSISSMGGGHVDGAGKVVQSDTFTVPPTSFSIPNPNASFTAWDRNFTPLFADSIITVTAGSASLVASAMIGGNAAPQAKLLASRASDNQVLATMATYENQQRDSSFSTQTLFGVYQCTSLTPLVFQTTLYNGRWAEATAILYYSGQVGNVLIQEIAQ